MNKNIEHYLFHKENFLDEKYCKNCINELNKSAWTKHDWYTPTTNSTHLQLGDKEPEICFVDSSSSKNIKNINDFIIRELSSTILEYIESLNFNWFVDWTGYSAIRFNRYLSGQTMLNHWYTI